MNAFLIINLPSAMCVGSTCSFHKYSFMIVIIMNACDGAYQDEISFLYCLL